MYSLMGFGATCLVTILVWFGWTVGRNNSMSNLIVLAIVLGLMMTFLLGGGFGSYLGSQTGHRVKAASTDANGIWLVKRATDGGDLRVAHFFGMHVMQAMPLLASLLPSTLAKKRRALWLLPLPSAIADSRR